MSDRNDTPPTIAVLGLGEAGGALARDLVRAGAVVRGYDPAVAAPEGAVQARDEADAATDADLVLSVNRASAATDALRAGLPSLRPDGVWVDLNTASPGSKRQLAELAEAADAAFVDVAIMAPVPGKGLRVPMLAAGPAAGRVARTLGALGAQVEVMAGGPGAAAERKLLRSVFFKGMAAAVYEALTAARAAGCEEWLRGNIVAELTAADASTVERLVTGTRRHAARRRDEMAAATHMLRELGVTPTVAAASRDLLDQLLTAPTPTAPGTADKAEEAGHA